MEVQLQDVGTRWSQVFNIAPPPILLPGEKSVIYI
jgi:hypothetical protein